MAAHLARHYRSTMPTRSVAAEACVVKNTVHAPSSDYFFVRFALDAQGARYESSRPDGAEVGHRNANGCSSDTAVKTRARAFTARMFSSINIAQGVQLRRMSLDQTAFSPRDMSKAVFSSTTSISSSDGADDGFSRRSFPSTPMTISVRPRRGIGRTPMPMMASFQPPRRSGAARLPTARHPAMVELARRRRKCDSTRHERLRRRPRRRPPPYCPDGLPSALLSPFCAARAARMMPSQVSACDRWWCSSDPRRWIETLDEVIDGLMPDGSLEPWSSWHQARWNNRRCCCRRNTAMFTSTPVEARP